MDWIKNLNRALEYVEDHITEELSYDRIAQEANSSKFHFLRVFSILTDRTLGEYIRERRLSLAAQEILSGQQKIIDIALKYRYENAGSFTKAFKRFHGITPMQAQSSESILKAAPPLKLIITIKGEEKMDYRIEKKDAFSVIGVSTEVSKRDDANFRIIPQFWKDKEEDGTVSEIVPGITSMGLMGICYDFDMDTEQFKYMIAIEGDTPRGKLDTLNRIDSYTWAVFPGKGRMPDAIQEVWKRVFHEWFPATNYEHAGGPEIEVYYTMDEESSFEVWIPVK